MSDSTISKMSVELEADQSRLDRDLEQSEEKTKASGKRMEEDLSLSGAAKGLLGALAAVGALEAGLRGAVGVVELFKGNTKEALEAFERMPFGIGGAVSAGKDLINVLSGAAEQSEQIAADFASLPSLVKAAQGEIASLQELLASPLGRNEQALAPANERTTRLNEQLAGLTDIINKLNRVEADRLSGTRDRFGEFDPASVRNIALFGPAGAIASDPAPGFGDGRIEDLPEGLRQALEEAGVAGKTIGDAVQQLREERDDLFRLGVDANNQAIDRVREIERDQTNAVARRGIDAADPFQAQRNALEDEFNKRLATAVTDEVADRLREEFERGLDKIDEAQRQFNREQRGFDLELGERRREAFEREVEQKAPAIPSTQSFSAEEFLRTRGFGGQKQEVTDPEATGILGTIRDLMQQARDTPHTASFG
ncbi:MAG: hypothetical protein ACPGVG_05635 [Mycobacterium sp.]